MSAQAAVFRALSAMHAADTGAGGLNETDGAALVRTFLREGYAETRTNNWPAVYVSMPVDNGNNAASAYHTFSPVRLRVETFRDYDYTAQDAVLARLYTKLHRQTITDPSGEWTFSPVFVARVVQLSPTDTTLNAVMEILVSS